MDNLRLTINLLFRHAKQEEIIRSLQEINPSLKADVNVEAEWFQRHFREEANIYTLDQIGAIYRILNKSWMMPPPQNGVISKNPKSVFNVLLHFNKELLLEQENKPVCRYEHLLKWHFLGAKVGEDLLTTSYLAAKDLADGAPLRNRFSWSPIIGHDNTSINYILNKGLVDLHFHLKGSSYNFDLNWLSLINSISGREKEFQVLKNYQASSLQMKDRGHSDSLYLMTIKACAIRYILFQKLTNNAPDKNDEALESLTSLLFAESRSETLMELSELERKIKLTALIDGKRYGNMVVDYAIPKRMTEEEVHNPELYLMKILSGERELMYRMFYEIYRNREDFELYATLFYAYLAAKTRIRQELVQLNEKIGFANFANYEGRKELFIREDSVYATLIPHMAVNGFVKEDGKNGLEARITPKSTGKELAKAIAKTDASIYDTRFHPSHRSPLLSDPNQPVRGVKDFQYILHFIKKEDKIPKQRDFFCRQHRLLITTAKEAKAIHAVRKQYPEQGKRIVAIDAANSEIYCRPEVFGQAFRFLRYEPTPKQREFLEVSELRDLCFTFHVGEDYMDLVDGLRAIDEALIYLNLRHGDRLGHALALGIDAAHYYEMANQTLVMPKQLFLDNVVWLWHKLQETGIPDENGLLHRLYVWYCQLFREIYQQCNSDLEHTPPILTYYQAWLLRGDDPYSYSMRSANESGKSSVVCMDNDYTPWQKQALNNLEEVRIARKNWDACSLYYRYHFDEEVKIAGEECYQFKIDSAYIRAVTLLQEKMRKDIEKRHICIETNPSSNYVIGTIARYIDHPIFKLYNDGINVDYPNSQIGVSINTDDQGVFSTSIEREFSLVALALEKRFEKEATTPNTPRVIYRWLDDIREMAFEQRFKK